MNAERNTFQNMENEIGIVPSGDGGLEIIHTTTAKNNLGSIIVTHRDMYFAPSEAYTTLSSELKNEAFGACIKFSGGVLSSLLGVTSALLVNPSEKGIDQIQLWGSTAIGILYGYKLLRESSLSLYNADIIQKKLGKLKKYIDDKDKKISP